MWTRRAFKQLEEDPDSLLEANAHVRVPVAIKGTDSDRDRVPIEIP